MRSRVFVSCGQSNVDERRIANDIRVLLERQGFQPYVAIQAQTLLDINSRIIGELKNCDCYLFVNFQREKIGAEGFRGSLFSNQEFAIAYAVGFDRILIVNQTRVQAEGMLRYIGVNTETFSGYDDCVEVVARALDRSDWNPNYARSLVADGLRVESQSISYGNPTTGATLAGNFIYIDIWNKRPDTAALEATARLLEYGKPGDTTMSPSHIRSPLKATGRPGFSHTVFPNSHEAFDLLCWGSEIQRPDLSSYFGFTNLGTSGTFTPAVGAGMYLTRSRKAYLNCALDVSPLRALPLSFGRWILRYQFLAIGFPLLNVDVDVTITENDLPTARILSQESA